MRRPSGSGGKTAAAILAATLLLVGAGGRARAEFVFSDDFDAERVGLALRTLANFRVVDGNVDVVGPGFFDLLPGNGRYVDLDGSLNDPGVLTSRDLALGAGSYRLSFDLAGSQRGEANAVAVAAGTAADPARFGSLALLRASADPFATFSLRFDVVAPVADFRFSFRNDGNDNFGALLDRVRVENLSVPEPSSLALGGLAALAGLAAARRPWRRRGGAA